jgi:hypothetical protein
MSHQLVVMVERWPVAKGTPLAYLGLWWAQAREWEQMRAERLCWDAHRGRVLAELVAALRRECVSLRT